jgi:hypothetical protein
VELRDARQAPSAVARRRRGRRAPEEPPLPERRAHRERQAALVLALDALRQDQGAGALALGGDRGDRGRRLRRRALLQQAAVEFHHVRPHHRQQREGARVGADVVERDAPARRAGTREQVDQLRRARGGRARRDLEHHREVAARHRRGAVEAVERRARDAVRLDVDEQRPPQARPPGAGDGGELTRPVELAHAVGEAGRVEHPLRVAEGRPREGLRRDGSARREVHDRLVDAVDRPGDECGGELRIDGRGDGVVRDGEGHGHPGLAGPRSHPDRDRSPRP